MPINEKESRVKQVVQPERRARFAAEAADRIRAADNCLFSLLPHDELSRLAGAWYEACAQGMLRDNYAVIDKWVRVQARLAATQGFAPADVLELLQICKTCVFELDCWNEDVFAAVDDVINQVFSAICAELPWNVIDDLDDEGAPDTGDEKNEIIEMDAVEASVPGAPSEEWTTERRRFARNRLHFPIRVIHPGHQGVQDITQTESVSRSGLYFISREDYQHEQLLKINFPYWSQPGAINKEFAAKVIRIIRLPGDRVGVGVEFLESLGRLEQRM